jgi:hypothetical protein
VHAARGRLLRVGLRPRRAHLNNGRQLKKRKTFAPPFFCSGEFCWGWLRACRPGRS